MDINLIDLRLLVAGLKAWIDQPGLELTINSLVQIAENAKSANPQDVDIMKADIDGHAALTVTQMGIRRMRCQRLFRMLELELKKQEFNYQREAAIKACDKHPEPIVH